MDEISLAAYTQLNFIGYTKAIIGSGELKFMGVLFGMGLLFISPLLVWYLYFYYSFVTSDYRRETKASFLKVLGDKGLLGEYYTSKELSKLPGYHKTLLNVYLPNEKGGTSETDLIFLHTSGIYVVESKNYSGWIFGKEKDSSWVQTLPGGRKNPFYNPVKQNKTHLDVIKRNIPEFSEKPFQSLIIFSKRCTLKKLEITSNDVHVLKRNDLKRVMNRLIQENVQKLTKDEIDEIYNTLRGFTNVTEEIKQNHIQQIKVKVK